MDINPQGLAEMVESGYVSARRHPTLPLTIYNYTAKAQYGRAWNDITRQCRGLWIDDGGEIVARPLPKFFNLSEHDDADIPDEPFEAFEKYDGCLIIVARYRGEVVVSSRGSFTSPQARIAREMIDTRGIDWVADGMTYMLELIHPDHRIVVDYRGEASLVHINVSDTATGEDVPYCRWPDVCRGSNISRAMRHRGSLSELMAQSQHNREGFVLRYRSGFRVKIKFDDYVRLHRLITGLSTRHVWEALAQGGDAYERLCEGAPDEMYDWMADVRAELEAQHGAMIAAHRTIFNRCVSGIPMPQTLGRKEVAKAFNASPSQNKGILFAMLDGKDYDSLAWKAIRPTGGVTFRKEEA